MWRQMAPQQSAEFRTAFLVNFFYQFEEGYRRQLCIDLDGFSLPVRGLGALYSALSVS